LPTTPKPRNGSCGRDAPFSSRWERRGSFLPPQPNWERCFTSKGSYEEAEKFTYRSQQATASDDIWSQLRWRGARAKLLAQRGAGNEAVRLVDEAVELAAGTDWLNMQAKLLKDRGDVLWAISHRLESMQSFEEAARLFERKGNLVSTAKVRTLLNNLRVEA
jgi:hypothetical protein